MDKFPHVSIIILNFNGEKWLGECFESLEKLSYPKEQLEVILGDNASTDNSVNFTRKNFPRIKIIQYDSNYGFCKTNNLCAKEARGAYLVFLNNDTFVTPDWLSNLVQGVLSEEGIVSCASKIVFPHLNGGHILNAAGGLIFITGSSIYEGWMDQDNPSYNIQKYTGFGCGAGVLVQKDFFLTTGGFDEYYFYSVEEMDLGMRAWLHGYKVLYVPSAVMYHYMGKTGFRGKGMTPTILFLVIRNSFYFILKNLEFTTVCLGLPLLICKTAYNLLHALRYGNIHAFFAIVKAYGCALKDLPQTLKARRETQRHRKVSDHQLHQQHILAGVKEVTKQSYTGVKNSQQLRSGCLYDTQDTVKIKKNTRGEFVFIKTISSPG